MFWFFYRHFYAFVLLNVLGDLTAILWYLHLQLLELQIVSNQAAFVPER